MCPFMSPPRLTVDRVCLVAHLDDGVLKDGDLLERSGHKGEVQAVVDSPKGARGLLQLLSHANHLIPRSQSLGQVLCLLRLSHLRKPSPGIRSSTSLGSYSTATSHVSVSYAREGLAYL